MDLNEQIGKAAIKSEHAQTYRAACNQCGREVEVVTQQNNDPEYYTEIHVKCQCGGAAKFELPVN